MLCFLPGWKLCCPYFSRLPLPHLNEGPSPLRHDWVISCLPVFIRPLINHSLFFSLSLSRSFALLPSLHPSQSCPVNPTDRSTKSLLYIHHIAESDIKNGRVFFLFFSFLLKLHIKNGAVQRKERQQGKQKGWKVREGLNPGIKISQFFYTLPLPHSNCS